jgi:hypothetical protein
LAANWRAISAPSPDDAPVIRMVDMAPSVVQGSQLALSGDWITTTVPMILSAMV